MLNRLLGLAVKAVSDLLHGRQFTIKRLVDELLGNRSQGKSALNIGALILAERMTDRRFPFFRLCSVPVAFWSGH